MQHQGEANRTSCVDAGISGLTNPTSANMLNATHGTSESEKNVVYTKKIEKPTISPSFDFGTFLS